MFRVFVCAVIAVGSVVAQHLTLPTLPYAYDALEPALSEESMRVHHLGHHAAYTQKLNKVLASMRKSSDKVTHDLAKLGIDQLMDRLDDIPDEFYRTSVRNNGGGFLNHELYFASMSPSGGGEPDGQLALAIDHSFGSFKEFTDAWSSAFKTLFGSGYVWLVLDSEATPPQLRIVQSANQDIPPFPASHRLLNLDAWEHAWYLQYQNVKATFLQAWLDKLVDWKAVGARYDAAIAGLTPPDL